MASSGTVVGSKNKGMWIEFRWNRSGDPDIANNRTTISWSFVLRKDSSLNFSASKSWSVSVNGTNYSGSYTSGASWGSSGGTKTLTSGSTTIGHSADGTKSFSVSATFNCAVTLSGVYVGSISLSGSQTLDTIPRASSVSLSTTGTYPNSYIEIYISRASSSFTHTITWSCGSSSGTAGTGVGTSIGWTVPASLINQAPNSNQTCTITCYTYSGGTHVGTKSVSFTVYAYGPSSVSSVSGNTIGSIFGVNISRASILFTHTIWYSFGSSTWQTIASGATTSASFTPPMTLCNQIPNSANGSMTIIIRTYYGATQIGADQYHYYTMYVPSSVVPEFGGITCIENVSDVASKVGAFVQNKTQLNLSITGAIGSYGSTIKTYKITVVGYTINAVSGITSVVTVSGSQTITAIITDSRGRTATRSMVINILPYAGPKLTGTKVDRNTDTIAIVTGQLSASSLITTVGEKNNLIYKIEYKKSDEYSYTLVEGTYSSIIQSLNRTIQQLDPTRSYEFKVTVGDVFGYSGTYEIIKISTAFKSFDFDVENGRLGIQKVLEHSGSIAEFPDDAIIYVGTTAINLKSLAGNTYRVGDIIISTNSDNPSKIYGGKWELLCPGKTLVCIDTSDTDFNTVKKTGGTKAHTLSATEMPSHSHSASSGNNSVGHTHTFSGTSGSAGAHTHNLYYKNIYMTSSSTNYWQLLRPVGGDSPAGTNAAAHSAGDHTHTFSGATSGISANHTHTITIGNTGSGSAHNNLQPYMAVYMWVKTA